MEGVSVSCQQESLVVLCRIFVLEVGNYALLIKDYFRKEYDLSLEQASSWRKTQSRLKTA